MLTARQDQKPSQIPGDPSSKIRLKSCCVYSPDRCIRPQVGKQHIKNKVNEMFLLLRPFKPRDMGTSPQMMYPLLATLLVSLTAFTGIWLFKSN